MVGCALRTHWFIKLAKLKPKFRPFKTGEYEIKTHRIAATVFCIVFLCLFWPFKAHENDVFKITVRLAVLEHSYSRVWLRNLASFKGHNKGAAIFVVSTTTVHNLLNNLAE